MLFLAIANGTFREAFLKKRMLAEKAQQVSTMLLLCLLVVYMVLIMRWFPPASPLYAFIIGLSWAFLTLVFEVGFGRYRGISWQTMLAEYNLLEGKLWALVPISLLLAPVVIYYITAL
ncbi:hypothetical protein HRH25_00165 [Flavisolibacter sp. BT320]|nr:hypothetical protein [Flavisolibacter longurius]